MANIEIYTTSLCGYCHAAKRLLAQKGVSYAETDVGRDSSKKAAMIQRANGGRRCNAPERRSAFHQR